MFDDVQPCRNATPEDESKDFVDVDHDSEATPSSKPKGKAKTRHQGKGVLPSSSCLATVLEDLEAEWRAHMALAAEVARLRGDANAQSFEKAPSLDKPAGLARAAEKVPEDAKLDGDLGEGQVVYLREEDEDTEVSEHSSHIDEAVDVNESAGPFGSMPLLAVEDFFVDPDPMWIIPDPDVVVFVDVVMRWACSLR
ncbi:hypothetical protein EV1_019003 [Malus domestica]